MPTAFVYVMSPRGLEPQLRIASQGHPGLAEQLVPASRAALGECVARYMIPDGARTPSIAECVRKFPPPPLQKDQTT